jgi:hypothetical protein
MLAAPLTEGVDTLAGTGGRLPQGAGICFV